MIWGRPYPAPPGQRQIQIPPASGHYDSIRFSLCVLNGGAVRRWAAGNPLLISQRRSLWGAPLLFLADSKRTVQVASFQWVIQIYGTWRADRSGKADRKSTRL